MFYTLWCWLVECSTRLLQSYQNICYHTSQHLFLVWLAMLHTQISGILLNDKQRKFLQLLRDSPRWVFCAQTTISVCNLYMTGNQCRIFKIGVISHLSVRDRTQSVELCTFCWYSISVLVRPCITTLPQPN